MAKEKIRKYFGRGGYAHYDYTIPSKDRKASFLEKAQKLKSDIEDYNKKVNEFNNTQDYKKKNMETYRRHKKFRDLGKEYYDLGIKEIKENNISLRDLIEVYDARILRYNKYGVSPFSNKVKENVSGNVEEYKKSIKETYNIDQENLSNKKSKTQEIKFLKNTLGLTDEQIEQKNREAREYYYNEVIPFKRKRNRYIESGLYEQLRWDVYVNNYIKAVEESGILETNDVDRLQRNIRSLKPEERKEFILRSPEIKAYYHASTVEDIEDDYGENVFHVLRSIKGKRRKKVNNA